MRYFLRFSDGSRVLADERGVLLPEIDHTRARAEMVQALEELLQEDDRAADAWAGWRMELANASGEVLFAINLDQANLGRSQACVAQ
jgi:hypothetical protein